MENKPPQLKKLLFSLFSSGSVSIKITLANETVFHRISEQSKFVKNTFSFTLFLVSGNVKKLSLVFDILLKRSLKSVDNSPVSNSP